MIKKKILPVIMCGGTGSRLWPLSRASFPKQFLELDYGNSTTFLQDTINRFKKILILKILYLYVMKNIDLLLLNKYEKLILRQGILLEPLSRNTALL